MIWVPPINESEKFKKISAAYAVLSWLLLQVGDVLFEALAVPEWGIKLLIGLLVIGFVPVVIFSWVYELTPEGIKKESEVDRSASVTSTTGRCQSLYLTSHPKTRTFWNSHSSRSMYSVALSR